MDKETDSVILERPGKKPKTVLCVILSMVFILILFGAGLGYTLYTACKIVRL